MEWWIPFCFATLLLILALKKLITKGKTAATNCQKCIFISGCDSGIGLQLAIHLDVLGCTVYAGCLSPDGDGAKLLKDCSDRMKVVPLDVTIENSVYSAVNFVKEDLKGKDLWAILNNAGVCIFSEFDWLTPRQCQLQLDINLCGTIRMTKAFLPLIRKSKGRIINVTSINGRFAYPGLSVYCATKFALEGFSEVLRLELAKYGVRVITVQPGDFARLTNIMKAQEKYQQEMWDYMNAEDKEFYNVYFHDYHKLVLKNYGLTSPKSFESTSLFEDIEEALFGCDPSSRYIVAPTTLKIFFFLLSVLPTRLTDSLMLYITKKMFDSLKKVGNS